MSLSCNIFRMPSPALIIPVPSPIHTEQRWTLHQARIRTPNHQASLWVLLALHQPPNHRPLFWVMVSLLVLSSCPPSLSMVERTEWRRKTMESEMERLSGSGSGSGTGGSVCESLGDSEPAVLVSEGDVVIGGLFPIHYLAPEPQHSYRNKPEQRPCSGFDHRAFRWVMTMVFAVEEINRNSTLLPGVKLGYRILDSCDHVHTSLRGALSLVTTPFSERGNMKERMEEREEGSREGGTAVPGCLKRDTAHEMELRTEQRMEGKLEERMEEKGEGGTEGTAAQPWCLAGAPVSAVIGLASSSPTRAVAHTLGPFSIPLVSYFATCTCLTDKSVYPSFLRTVPSDLFQVRGLVQLVTHFGWRWVGTVGTQDDYSRYGIQAFSRQLEEQGGCLAFHLTIPNSPSPAGLQALADSLQSSSARVIVAFATEGQLLGLLSELALRNFTGIQWVASEAWVTASLLTSPHFQPLLEGTLGFSFPGVSIPGLEEFLLTVRPSPRQGSELVNLFWEELFGCKLEFGEDSIRGNAESSPIEDCGGNPLDSPLNEDGDGDGDGSRLNSTASSAGEPLGSTRETGGRGSKSAGGTPVCTGSEYLRDTESSYTDVSQVRISYNVYKAVYVIAHALHRLLHCDSTGHSQAQGRCQTSKSFTPRQLLQYLKRVNFTNQFGEKVHFDSNGEPVPLYDIMNWQRDGSGSIRFQKVGSYDGSAPLGQQLLMKESAIVWMGGQSQVPVSLCSDPCLPGSRQARRPGEPSCCFDCLPCADGQISNQTGSTECTKCPEFYWSDRDRVNCVAGVEDFLSISETMGAILVSLSLLGVVTTTVITVIFHRFRATAIVKANNSELSFLLLLSLKLCFLCSLVFIGRPSIWACRFRQAAFGVSFVLCLSCLLVKTIVVLLAFRANLPGCSSLKLFGPPQQRALILCTTAPQVCLCAGWLSLASPFPFKNTSYQGTSGKVVLECKEPWPAGFPLVLGYIGLLASLCLLLAFLGRKLPDTFNEAKLITFSMLIFCAVWITFIPAYVSSPGKYTVAVEIFAILASSFGLLLCIFAPKCYIILLRPERNTKKGITGKPSRLT